MNVHLYFPTGYALLVMLIVSFPFSFLPSFSMLIVFLLFIVMFPVAFSGSVMMNINPFLSVTLMSYGCGFMFDSSLSTVSFPVAVVFRNVSSPVYLMVMLYLSGRMFPRSIVVFRFMSVIFWLCFLPVSVMFTFPVAVEL